MIKSQGSADLVLFLIATAWGTTYLLTDLLYTELDAFTQISLRFFIGFFVIALFSRAQLKKPSKKNITWSVILGLVLTCVYIGATFAVKHTSLTNAGFLSCITIAFIPVFSFIYGLPVTRKSWFLVGLTLLGVALLTLDGGFSLKASNLKGDLLALFCAASYANHLLLTQKAVEDPEVDPFQIGAYQLLCVALSSLVLALVFEDFHLPTQAPTWGALVFMGIFCTGVSFIVQPIALRYTTATHTAVIYTMEPLAAAFLAWALAGEVMTRQSLIGAAILIFSILYMELGSAKKEEDQAKP